jgi:hypothetical protein
VDVALITSSPLGKSKRAAPRCIRVKKLVAYLLLRLGWGVSYTLSVPPRMPAATFATRWGVRRGRITPFSRRSMLSKLDIEDDESSDSTGDKVGDLGGGGRESSLGSSIEEEGPRSSGLDAASRAKILASSSCSLRTSRRCCTTCSEPSILEACQIN